MSYMVYIKKKLLIGLFARGGWVTHACCGSTTEQYVQWAANLATTRGHGRGRIGASILYDGGDVWMARRARVLAASPFAATTPHHAFWPARAPCVCRAEAETGKKDIRGRTA
jgi:hypothetical protein